MIKHRKQPHKLQKNVNEYCDCTADFNTDHTMTGAVKIKVRYLQSVPEKLSTNICDIQDH